MMRTSFLLVVALASYAHAGPKQTAQDHIARATAAHHDGKYELALSELQAAYELDPKPALLFAIAQVHGKLDQCEDAITYYEKFLATTSDHDTRAVVEEAIAACKKRLAAAEPAPEPEPSPEPEPPAPPEPEPEPPPAAKAEPPPPPKPAPSRRVAARPFDDAPTRREVPVARTPWYQDKLGDTLVIGGVLALAGGAISYRAALGDLDDAEAAPDLATYNDKLDAASGKRTYAVILTAGGAALVGAGIVRYVLRKPETSTRIGARPTHGGGLVTLWRRF